MFLELNELITARDVWCRCATGLKFREILECNKLLGLGIRHTFVLVGLAVPFLVVPVVGVEFTIAEGEEGAFPEVDILAHAGLL